MEGVASTPKRTHLEPALPLGTDRHRSCSIANRPFEGTDAIAAKTYPKAESFGKLGQREKDAAPYLVYRPDSARGSISHIWTREGSVPNEKPPI